jgi:hypothetical protein
MQAGNSSVIRFCALEYKSEERGRSQSDAPRILLLLIRTRLKKLRVLVAPNWRTFVSPGDQEYIASLLDDFGHRAVHDGEALLKHVSSLAVGPLVTYRTGAKLQDHPDLLHLSNSFQEL